MMISLVIFEYEIPFNIKKARKLQEWNEMAGCFNCQLVTSSQSNCNWISICPAISVCLALSSSQDKSWVKEEYKSYNMVKKSIKFPVLNWNKIEERKLCQKKHTEKVSMLYKYLKND